MRSERKCYSVFFLFMVVCLFGGEGAAWALPEFLLRFSRDPFSRPEFRTQCSTCHLDPKGSGPRNPFGSAFEKNKHVVTPEFRQAWPDHFLPSVTTDAVPSAQGTVKATLLGNEQDAILEINGERFRLKLKEGKLEKITVEEAANIVATPPPPAPALREPKLPLREQPTFDYHLVNLPTTLPYEKGSLSMRFTHRFTQPVLRVGEDCDGCGGITDLIGFDSFSYSSLGGTLGINKWLAATVYRSPLDRTYEMGGVVQLLRQQGREPFSAALRVSVESRRLFVPERRGYERFQTTNLVFPVSRAISNIAELFVVPAVSFHANPMAPSPGPSIPEGETREHLGTIGLGASIRFRPRTAFVMEWMPRVAGFRAEGSRNAYSFGLLRSTNRHVFELVLTNSFATTTSRSISTGSRDFALGFNLYRRLR